MGGDRADAGSGGGGKAGPPRSSGPFGAADQAGGYRGGSLARRRFAFRRLFDASNIVTRQVLADLVEALRRAGIAEEEINTLELGLAEVLNNVTKHAYGGATGPADLLVLQAEAGFVCRVGDQGKPLSAGSIPDPALPLTAPPDCLPEGGFGWPLIHRLASGLSYEQKGGENGSAWNRLTLHFTGPQP